MLSIGFGFVVEGCQHVVFAIVVIVVIVVIFAVAVAATVAVAVACLMNVIVASACFFRLYGKMSYNSSHPLHSQGSADQSMDEQK